MASDQLNEIGKYIRQSGDNANRALKKQHPLRPTVERTRDIFDSDVEFNMEFDVKSSQKSIVLDLDFNKPPPMNNCRTNACEEAFCDTFDNLSSGTHELLLNKALKPSGILGVYLNGLVLPTSSYTIISYGTYEEEGGRILVANLPLLVNTISICYMAQCTVLFTGHAFGAMIVQGEGGYQHIGADPPAGWYEEPDIGPIRTTMAGIEILEDMVVRIEARAELFMVPGRCDDLFPPGGCPCSSCGGISYGFSVTGTEDQKFEAACGGYVLSHWFMSDQTVFLSAGSVIKVSIYTICAAEAGGIYGFGNNNHWLRVGRLPTVMNSGTEIWYGADS